MDDQRYGSLRPLMFSVAYRMLGSATEAEDVVQDAWLRLTRQDRGDVRSLDAYATTVVTRLCLDRLKSARVKREEYVGPWLPEPVLTTEAGPHALLEQRESVTLAFLVLLETLTPEERAVFLLKEVFDYGHEEVADMLGLNAAHSRQLLHRAKARIAEGRPRGTAAAAYRPLAERFAAALGAGDAEEMHALLAEDVGFWSDGGGKVAAARRPLFGREPVANFLVGLKRSAIAAGLDRQASLSVIEVNHEPAVVLRVDGHVDGVWFLSTENGRIVAIRVVRNPDKLAYVSRQLGGELSAPTDEVRSAE
jgi:RNA polymerase sigma-70 factor (ECF subfamily)